MRQYRFLVRYISPGPRRGRNASGCHLGESFKLWRKRRQSCLLQNMETKRTLPLRLNFLQLRFPSDLRDNGALHCACTGRPHVEACHPHIFDCQCSLIFKVRSKRIDLTGIPLSGNIPIGLTLLQGFSLVMLLLAMDYSDFNLDFRPFTVH